MFRKMPRYHSVIAFLLMVATSSCSIAKPQVIAAVTQSPSAVATHTPAPTSTSTPTALPTRTPLPQVRVELGERALFIGDYENAMREHRTAFEKTEDVEVKAAALVGLARTYYEESNYSLALSTLKQVLNEYGETKSIANAYFLLGQTYDETSQYQEAAAAYRQYLDLRPEPLGAFVLERIGDSLSNAGDSAGAIEAYQAAIDTQEAANVIRLQIRIGNAFLDQGDYASAIRTFLSVYDSTDNEYTRAQMNLAAGRAYLAIGEEEQAYARFQDSVNNYPRAYDSYAGLLTLVEVGVPVNELQRGLVDYYAEQYGVAIDAFNRYLNSDAEHNGMAHYYKGMAHRALEEYEAAIAEWQEVIEAHQEDEYWVKAWEEIAYTQWAWADRYQQAADTLLQFVSRYPTYPAAPNMLFQAAQILERDGQLTKAAETWERMIAEYPSAEKTYRGLFLAGITRYRTENYDAALTAFQRTVLLATNPSDQAASYLWIGKTQLAKVDDASAQASFQSAAKIDPTGYYSERASEILENQKPFTADQFVPIEIDWDLERTKAETWVRTTFDLPIETNLRDPGELSGEPAFRRAMALHELGLYAEARNEFEALREQIKDEPANTMRLIAPLLELGYHRSAILASRQVLSLAYLDDADTLTAPVYFNYIRFGLYFEDLVIEAAETEEFDPYFLWSVIRQESMFEAHVISSAGAAGLMQIMPATGQEIASRLNWPPGYEQSDLYRPVVNIRMGTSYLAFQRDQFGGAYEALAAYNAGPGNAYYWKEIADGDPDLFLEVIRFEETRRYIRQIYEFWNIYQHVYVERDDM